MNKEIENILDDCLERLLVRGETIKDCLNAYPQQADILKSLLHTALLAKKSTGIEPRPEFKARARYQFRMALQEASANKDRFLSRWRFRWAAASAAIIVMFIASGGLAVAAGYSMPDSPLYSLKLAVEQMQINLTSSDLGKVKLYAEFADRRVSEITYMAQKGKTNQVLASTNLLNDQLAMITKLTAGSYNNWQDNRTLAEGGQSMPEVDKAQTAPPAMLTPVPAPSISLPAPVVTPLPATITDSVFQEYLAEEGEFSEIFNLLLQNGRNNLITLHDSLSSVPESTQSSLLEAISVLEGYYDAISAIID